MIECKGKEEVGWYTDRAEIQRLTKKKKKQVTSVGVGREREREKEVEQEQWRLSFTEELFFFFFLFLNLLHSLNARVKQGLSTNHCSASHQLLLKLLGVQFLLLLQNIAVLFLIQQPVVWGAGPCA
jgi:hypothetical protein